MLVGNPNVGKSTIYNYLCQANQHTGNWAGKTVESAKGYFTIEDYQIEVIDLPGIYSFTNCSEEELVTKNYLENENYDLVIVVINALLIERSIPFLKQILRITNKVMIIFNLYDEAKKNGMDIDEAILNKELHLPFSLISAKRKDDLKSLKQDIIEALNYKPLTNKLDLENTLLKCISYSRPKKTSSFDYLLTNKVLGPLLMLMSLMLILFLTIVLANYPSALLSSMFSSAEGYLIKVLESFAVSKWIIDLCINYIYRIISLVISVMLPPMVIFFPLFAVLEDIGYLPRIAFNLDYWFQKVGASGKQALSICMGYGCNVVGVLGTRIIESPKERMLAIITNAFTPCNGRFPTLITLITLCLVNQSVLKVTIYLAILIVFSLLMSFISTYVLKGLLKHQSEDSYILELSDYRQPNWLMILKDSLINKTFKILNRAIIVVVPSAIFVYLLQNTIIHNQTLATYLIQFLTPLGNIMGLDGVILLSFIIGIMANEMVLPLCLMFYSNNYLISNYSFEVLKEILIINNWTTATAICMMIFCILHFPCINTLITIYKETKSWQQTLLAFAYPTFFGILICIVANVILSLML